MAQGRRQTRTTSSAKTGGPKTLSKSRIPIQIAAQEMVPVLVALASKKRKPPTRATTKRMGSMPSVCFLVIGWYGPPPPMPPARTRPHIPSVAHVHVVIVQSQVPGMSSMVVVHGGCFVHVLEALSPAKTYRHMPSWLAIAHFWKFCFGNSSKFSCACRVCNNVSTYCVQLNCRVRLSRPVDDKCAQAVRGQLH